MEILIKALQLILSLSILVVLHELGHFLPAKYFKTKVEKFYLFFDPWFSVFKKKIGDTEYGVGWLPLGGYVKIAGMIDESMDKEQLEKPAEPWEFRAKPAWQRLIIMIGGVAVNIMLAFVIYVFVLFFYGEKYLPSENATSGIYCDSLALAAGFEHGDVLYAIDNQKVIRFASEGGGLHSEVIEKLILNDASQVTVVRGGRQITIPFTEETKAEVLNKKGLFYPALPFVVNRFNEDSPLEKAGGEVGDEIIMINGQKMNYAGEVMSLLPTLKGQNVDLVVLRGGGDTLSFNIFLEEDVVGANLRPFVQQFEMAEENYTLLSAVPAAFTKTGVEIKNYLKQFRLIKKSPESIGGFISIGSIFPSEWDWERFWNLTAFLSIMLAVLNLLPIPALDGGHVMFLLYEVVSGRKPHEKVVEYAQILGLILLLGLVLYANGNDIFKLLS